MAITNDVNELDKVPLLRLKSIGKKYGEFSALDDVELDIFSGRIHCMLGENGAGKSTLCKIIYGEEVASSGSMLYAGNDYEPLAPADALANGIAMVHQHFSLIHNMSVYENLMLGYVSGVLDVAEFVSYLINLSKRYGLDIDPYSRVSELSVGQQQRVEILKCLMREPRLLILDEPTAVLLPDEIDALLTTCKQIVAEGRSIVLVTHKLAEISRVADEVTVLRGGKQVMQCEFSEEQVDAMISAMIGSEIAISDLRLAGLSLAENIDVIATTNNDEKSADRKASQCMIIDDLSFVDERGNQCLSNITLEIKAGEIHGLAGVEGNGQTELGDILAGLSMPTSGRLYMPDFELTHATPSQITAAGVGIVPENRHRVGCIEELDLTENLLLSSIKNYSRFGLLNRKAMRDAAKILIDRFDVRAPSADVGFNNLSGGNQQKAVLAREISIESLRFLLAAHPTRGLDIGAVFAVYEHIRNSAKAGVGVLLISSELDELIAVCEKISVIYRGQIVGTLPADPQYRDQIGALMSGSGIQQRHSA